MVFHYTVRKLFIPFLTYMMTYVIYMSGIYLYRHDNETMEIVNYVALAILLIYSLYFCWIELS